MIDNPEQSFDTHRYFMLYYSDRERDRAVLHLLDQVELTDRQERLQGARAILYLVQVGGSFST